MAQLTRLELATIMPAARAITTNADLFSKLCSLEQLHDADPDPDWYEYDATIRSLFDEAGAGGFFQLITTRRDPFGFTAIHKTTGRAVAFSVKHVGKYDLLFNAAIVQ